MLIKIRCFFFQAEDGIRSLVRSRGLGDVYKRQPRVDAVERPPVGAPVELQWHREQAGDDRGAGVGLSLIHI